MNLHAVVDIGSNGIRFSITHLCDLTSRLLPTRFIDRAAISLYDAQWSNGVRSPISSQAVKSTIQALLKFKQTCEEFAVPANRIRVVATEATRVAPNAAELTNRVRDTTGWTVELLSVEREGILGAWGIVSSLPHVHGLTIDMGGGSVQFAWVDHGRVVERKAGSSSLPYGAAALSKLMAQNSSDVDLANLKQQLVEELKDAVATVAPIEEVSVMKEDSAQSTPLNVYVSGGGFRGWGFLLMHQSGSGHDHYPISIINGFEASPNEFTNVSLAQGLRQQESDDLFRISERRVSQLPAVAFLVECLQKALPPINKIHFTQGGVREGLLFSGLPEMVRTKQPIDIATVPMASKSWLHLCTLLRKALPTCAVEYVTEPLIKALAQSMYAHEGFNKDIQAACALRCTTTGLLANTHGIDHPTRAILAIMLCERWGGKDDVSSRDAKFYDSLVSIIPAGTAWWAVYLGRLARIFGRVFPCGIVAASESGTMKIEVSEAEQDGYRQVLLSLKCSSTMVDYENFLESVKKLEKLGKKSKWPNKTGWKVKVEASATDENGSNLQ